MDGVHCENRPAQKNMLLTVRLCSEQSADELRLANGISLGDPPHLPFLTMSIASIPRKVRHAVASEAFRQPRSTFHIAMVLLHDVV
jgi:hypothetical protein